MPARVKTFFMNFCSLFSFFGHTTPFTPKSGLLCCIKLRFDDHGSFVIFRSVSVRPRHLIDQNFDHEYFFKLPLQGAGCPITSAVCYSHHVASRAVPRTNRIRTKANTHSRSATSSTNESPSCDPSQLWLCSCAGGSPGVCTDAASAGCSVRPLAQPPQASSVIRNCPAC